MPSGVAYLDSSAIVKLALRESESSALKSELLHWEKYATSVISKVEVRFAAMRQIESEDEMDVLVFRVLRLVSFISLNNSILERAMHMKSLRTLDAIQLSSALELDAELGVLIAYDKRLLSAAVARGIPVASPC